MSGPPTRKPSCGTCTPWAGNTIPYALAHPIAIDAWNQNTNGLGEDGFVDRLYFGDLFGYFYALKFAFDDPSVGNRAH